MSGPAMLRVIEALERRGHIIKWNGNNRATTRCTHDGADNPHALSIFDNGSRVNLHCFTAECDNDTIRESLGLSISDLYHDARDRDLAQYRYDDGRIVHRQAGKRFMQTGNKDAIPTLYRAGAVAKAVAEGTPVYLVEGEEDVHSLESVGCVATTAPMGARNFDKVSVGVLQGARVIAIRDEDEPGQRWAELVAERLDGVAASVRFAHVAAGKDITDHIAAGLGAADLRFDADPEEVARAATLARYPALNLAAVLDPNRPPREYVLDGLIPAGVAVSLAAPAGTGKSLLSLAIALSVARGRRSFAGLTIPKRRRVLYVDMENTTDDLAERFESFGVRRGDTLDGLTYLSFPEIPPLDTPDGGRQVSAILDAYGIGPGDLVVIDSLQRVIQGEENSADTMRGYYLFTGLTLKRRGVTSLRLDNTGKDTERGSRGTSGKRDDVDLELVMLPDADDPEKFRIHVRKTRLSDIPSLNISRYVGTDGQTIFSTADDPFRSAVNAARTALEQAGVPTTATVHEARQALYGRFEERTLRVAMREHRGTLSPALAATCTECGYPMTDVGDGSTTHPGCEER